MPDADLLDLEVVDEPVVAAAMLDSVRAKVLASLVEPGSASTVAAAIGESRQKVNYHLRSLEDHGLVRLLEERPRRGLTERVMIASARSYVLSPDVIRDCAADPAHTDRLSTRYLIAVAARMVREIAGLAQRADKAGKPLATLTIDSEIRFASAEDRAQFTRELGDAITTLAARYHDEATPGGRWHRLIVAAYPSPAGAAPDSRAPAEKPPKAPNQKEK